jgi:tetratricopeptide (TPR) repeat protein
MQESASFWTDIKNLEEQLAKSPDSLCFARLSEVYFKVGLVDDALHVARQGVKKHPRYLSGQRALSLACHAKGLNDEALAALQLVTEALPEDVSSQKLLGRLLIETGNQGAAVQALRTALEFAPDDVECRIELESLGRSAEVPESTLEPYDDDGEIIEDLEILEEDEVLEDGQPESEPRFQPPLSEADTVALQHHDPLSTGTLAELYVRQGFINKALEIYRAILADNPADRVTAKRIVELGALEPGPGEAVYTYEAEDEPGSDMSSEAFFQETRPEALSQSAGVSAFESQHPGTDVFPLEDNTPVVLPKGVADNALSTLDGWLENIRRIKSCR